MLEKTAISSAMFVTCPFGLINFLGKYVLTYDTFWKVWYWEYNEWKVDKGYIVKV